MPNKTISILLLAAVLSGCATQAVPVKRTFPAADPVMMEPAPVLTTLPAETQDLDKLLSNSAENYSRYRELTLRLKMWQEWYTRQKQNFDSVP